MRSYPLLIFLLVFLLVSVVVAKSETEEAPRLLAAALATYANLSIFHIEGTRVSNSTDEVQHTWEQETFTIAQASSTQYRYDVKIPDRWNVLIADGVTEWEFQPWRNEYTRRSIPTTKPNPDSSDDVIRYATQHQARFYVQELQRGIDVRTAEFLNPGPSRLPDSKYLALCFTLDSQMPKTPIPNLELRFGSKRNGR